MTEIKLPKQIIIPKSFTTPVYKPPRETKGRGFVIFVAFALGTAFGYTLPSAKSRLTIFRNRMLEDSPVISASSKKHVIEQNDHNPSRASSDGGVEIIKADLKKVRAYPDSYVGKIIESILCVSESGVAEGGTEHSKANYGIVVCPPFSMGAYFFLYTDSDSKSPLVVKAQHICGAVGKYGRVRARYRLDKDHLGVATHMGPMDGAELLDIDLAE